jgi:hypothetical protein
MAMLVDNFSPSLATELTVDQPGLCDFSGGDDCDYLYIFAQYAGHFEVVGQGSKSAGDVDFTFGPYYTGVENTFTPITNGATFSVLRDGGWPDTSVLFTVHTVDDLNETLHEQHVWPTVANGIGIPVVNTDPPLVEYLNTPASSADSQVIRVTHANGLSHVVVSVELPTAGVHDLAYHSLSTAGFAPRYVGGSTVAPVTTDNGDGVLITLVRSGGWPGRAPLIHVTAAGA